MRVDWLPFYRIRDATVLYLIKVTSRTTTVGNPLWLWVLALNVYINVNILISRVAISFSIILFPFSTFIRCRGRISMRTTATRSLARIQQPGDYDADGHHVSSSSGGDQYRYGDRAPFEPKSISPVFGKSWSK